tara:strand:- start:75 stop:635 length:561 start_codon:yes stop_codon:yes gene_type:complete
LNLFQKIANNIRIKCIIKASNNGGNGKVPGGKMARANNNNNNNNSIVFQFTLKEIQDIIKAALIDAVYDCTLGKNITNLMKKPIQVILKYFDMKPMYYIFHLKYELGKINPKDITKKYFKNVFKKLLCNVNFELNKVILNLKILNNKVKPSKPVDSRKVKPKTSIIKSVKLVKRRQPTLHNHVITK